MANGGKRFWDERLGLDELRSRLLDRRIPGSVTWLHTLGSIGLSLLFVLIVTGILLSLSYSPSTEHAYHSIRYAEGLPFGRLIRGLHHWAASVLVVVVALHLLHTLLTMAHIRPRELTWFTGVLMFIVVLGFAFTGYLLPWDEKAYWATVVGTSMAGQFPIIGDFLLYVLRGGEAVGAATLARFYGLHVTMLPALLVLFLVVHLYLVVLHGIANRHAEVGGGDSRSRGARKRSYKPFWPDVLAMDATAALLVLALVVALALSVGAPLEAPADPTNTQYVPRPEWYFLPLFQMLKYFPGRLEPVGAVIIPFFSVAAVVGLPWLTAVLARRRWGVNGLRITIGGALAAVVALGVAGARDSGTKLSEPAPAIARGRLLYDQLGCTNCHSIRGVGGIVGPDLTLVGLRRPDSTWLAEHLREPTSLVAGSPMPRFPLEGEQLGDLVAFLLSLGNDLRHTPAAAGIFEGRCMACHRLAGRGGSFGPDLGKVGRLRTVAFLHQYVEDPSSLNEEARMPRMVGLSHDQVEDVSRYIVATALTTGASDE